jgi:hypothetical protein
MKLVMDLTNVRPFDPLQFEQFPEGAYKVKIESAEANDKGNVLFTVRSLDEPALNDTTGIMLGVDDSKKGNRSHYKALCTGVYEAMGQDPAAITGKVEVDTDDLLGKEAYIYVKHAPEGQLDDQGRRPFPNRNFVTKEFYEAQRRAMLGGNGVATGKGAVAAPPAAAPAQPKLGSLFARKT